MKLFILVALFGLGLAQHNPHTKHGRTAIVHLFEWRWADIAAECERYLAPNGFGGVQVCMAEHGWVAFKSRGGGRYLISRSKKKGSDFSKKLLFGKLTA